MKKIIIILLNTFILICLYSNDSFFYNRSFLVDRFQHIDIKDDNIIYFENGPDGYSVFFNGKFKIYNYQSFDFLEVNKNKYIVFYLNETIMLYDFVNKNMILGTDYSLGGFKISLEPNLFRFASIQSNSFLKEGDISFLPSNLENFDLKTPWIEGESDDGISVDLYLDLGTMYPTDNIIFVNGYFDPDNLNLYNENNRIKKIRITGIDNLFSFETVLIDTPNLQMINLPDKAIKFKITILSVYKGIKYNDTCLSGIFTNYYMAYP